jgi:hypothetical protein
LTGFPTPSSFQSTEEYDGITVPTWCLRTAGTYCRSDVRQNSPKVVTSTPWSIVYFSFAFPVPYSVAPSPAKCLAEARTRSGSSSWPGRPCSPSMAVSICSTSAGFSLNDSYVRPQRSSRAAHTQGANAHCGPEARVSSAVTW